MEMTREEKEQLLKLSKEMSDKLSDLAKENGREEDGKAKADALEKEEMAKRQKDILDKIENLGKEVATNKVKSVRFVYGDKKELAPDEIKISFGTWLKMIKYNHPGVSGDIFKTSMNEGTPAQGGYTVPTEYESMIIGELNNAANMISKFTRYPQNAPTKQIPKWLTDMAIYWVAEEGDKTVSKPTLTYKNSVLKKMAVIVKFTDELLEDNISNLDTWVAKLVAENFATELQRVALVGNTGAGDPFMGIAFSVGIDTVAMIGATLAYQDLVNTWNNTTILENYRNGAEWMMNRRALGLCMNLVDLQNRPLWNLMSFNGAMVNTILGDVVNVCQEITDVLGDGTQTNIFYGNPKYVFIGEKAGSGGIQVDVSNSAIISSSTSVSENLWQQDLTGYRFVLRRGVLVAVPEAFSVLQAVA
jgi:HK97 family phage major capsid protein